MRSQILREPGIINARLNGRWRRLIGRHHRAMLQPRLVRREADGYICAELQDAWQPQTKLTRSHFNLHAPSTMEQFI